MPDPTPLTEEERAELGRIYAALGERGKLLISREEFVFRKAKAFYSERERALREALREALTELKDATKAYVPRVPVDPCWTSSLRARALDEETEQRRRLVRARVAARAALELEPTDPAPEDTDA